MQFSGVRNKLISALPLRVADEGTSVYGGKVWNDERQIYVEFVYWQEQT